MREGSALLERLEKRFQSIDSRADRRSVGMRDRDSFLGHFSERMGRLENLVQIPEMSAFRRLPKMGARFDPWGNMGGWSVINDLTYLEWMAEQEQQVEEEETERVSAWGTANGYQGGKKRPRKSAWLNTPYTPARVAGKQLPKPQSRGQRNDNSESQKAKSKRVRQPVGSQSQRTKTALAPKLSPLTRAMGRATIAQEHRSNSARVMNSLPPMLSKTVGQKWVEQEKSVEQERSARKVSKASRSSMNTSSSIRMQGRSNLVPSTFGRRGSLNARVQSPMLKVLHQELSGQQSDNSLSQSALASSRMKRPESSQLIASNDTALKDSITFGKNRGLRTVSSQSPLLQGAKSAKAISTSEKAEFQNVVQRKVIETIGRDVPKNVRKVIQSTLSGPTGLNKGTGNVDMPKNNVGMPKNIVESVVTVVERTFAKQVLDQVSTVFATANVESISQLEAQTGTSVSQSIRRIQKVIDTVTTEVLQQNKAMIEQVARSVVKGNVEGNPSENAQNTVVTQITQRKLKQISSALQEKGVSRQLADKVIQNFGPSTLDLTQSVEDIVEVLTEQAEFKRGRVTKGALLQEQGFGLKKDSLTRTVTRQLEPLFQQLQGKNTAGADFWNRELSVGKTSSLLPNLSMVGESLPDRIIADVVEEISRFAERETMIEGSSAQDKLMNTLNKTVSKLVSETRKMRGMVDLNDVVNVQPVGMFAADEGEEETFGMQGSGFRQGAQSGAFGSKESPWMTSPSATAEVVAKRTPKGKLQPMQQAAARVLNLMSTNPTRPEIIARHTGLQVGEVQQIVAQLQGFSLSTVEKTTNQNTGTSVSNQIGANAKKSEASGRTLARTSSRTVSASGLGALAESVTGQPQIAGQQGLNRLNEKGDKYAHPLEKVWERATSPIQMPEWRGMGTSSFTPIVGESAKGWRLSPKRRPMYPYAVDTESTLLQPTDINAEGTFDGDTELSANKSSPWFSGKDDVAQQGFGFVPQSISGDAKLSSREISMFGQSQSVQLTVGDLRNQTARWLEPNRTVVLDNGTVIHAKVAKRLGMSVKAQSPKNLPLSWTLEGVQLKSDHKSLPGWAKRASGRPLVKASPEFLVALAKTSSAEEVAEVILQNSNRAEDGILPRTAMTAIDQIRREAHRSLQDLSTQQEEIAQSLTSKGRRSIGASKRRVSRTARAVMDGFTGLKPISTATPSTDGQVAGNDKVSKLAKQLESLVSLAENNRRDEAREGVRMAEESHDAIAEGQAGAKGEERDYDVDIDALRQEVMQAFEQEMSIRSLRSFDNSNNTDPWW